MVVLAIFGWSVFSCVVGALVATVYFVSPRKDNGKCHKHRKS